MNIEFIDGGVCAPAGFKAAGVHVGFRKNKKRKDLALIVSEAQASAAAVYTQNKIKGAPYYVNREHLRDGKARAIICNSGNANTCAPNGVEVARQTCELAAEALKIDVSDMVVCSTGVIGEPFSIDPFVPGIPKAVKALSEEGSDAAAHAIMTTDTHTKEFAISFKLGGKDCRMGGIAKGSGMINPNMATMLCFITTDAAVEPKALQKALDANILDTFNQISIDGDTSTNDSVIVLANGLAGNAPVQDEGGDYDDFCAALRAITVEICRGIAKDGEGASKLLECVVSGAPSAPIARKIAKTIIQSELVKTAVFGEDANWGRVVCAVGYTEGDFPVDNIDVKLASEAGEIDVCRGSEALVFDEDLAKDILSKGEIFYYVDLNAGDGEAVAYGCDLTYDYVRINGKYRT